MGIGTIAAATAAAASGHNSRNNFTGVENVSNNAAQYTITVQYTLIILGIALLFLLIYILYKRKKVNHYA